MRAAFVGKVGPSEDAVEPSGVPSCAKSSASSTRLRLSLEPAKLASVRLVADEVDDISGRLDERGSGRPNSTAHKRRSLLRWRRPLPEHAPPASTKRDRRAHSPNSRVVYRRFRAQMNIHE